MKASLCFAVPKPRPDSFLVLGPARPFTGCSCGHFNSSVLRDRSAGSVERRTLSDAVDPRRFLNIFSVEIIMRFKSFVNIRRLFWNGGMQCSSASDIRFRSPSNPCHAVEVVVELRYHIASTLRSLQWYQFNFTTCLWKSFRGQVKLANIMHFHIGKTAKSPLSRASEFATSKSYQLGVYTMHGHNRETPLVLAKRHSQKVHAVSPPFHP